MTDPALYCGFNTGIEEDSDLLDRFEADLMCNLRQSLDSVGAILGPTAHGGTARLHIPFTHRGASLRLAVVLVGMVPSRWLIAITGATMDDCPHDVDVAWLRQLVESVVGQTCDSSVRWYTTLEDVPMA